MLSALYPEIDWNGVRSIGFDMDGTLYDECEFITQVYAAVSEALCEAPERELLRRFMLERWLEKGSSYPHIFDEAAQRFNGLDSATFTQEALGIFRAFTPRLSLPSRTEALLSHCSKRYELFIISDGNPQLQERKFAALGLERFFGEEQRLFPGRFGGAKPDPKILEHAPFACEPETSVFFGDREMDASFARSVGMRFMHVYNMTPKGKSYES